MIKVLKGEDIKRLDECHLALSNQSSLELMEQAAKAFCQWFVKDHPVDTSVTIWCGAGNNGGDGFAIARLLDQKGCKVRVKCCFNNSAKLSPDAQRNFDRLPETVKIGQWDDHSPDSEFLIDAFLGVGLKGELREDARQVVSRMNQSSSRKISVDIPSGLESEKIATGVVFHAEMTISFAQPKLALLLPENQDSVGALRVLDIGILSEAYEEFDSRYFYLTKAAVRARHRFFGRFSHKGTYGKVMLMGGSAGKMGAILLSGRSALRTGTGLLQLNIDSDQNLIAQLGLPEAMTNVAEMPDIKGLDALGIGPGWGRENRKEKLAEVFLRFEGPLVLDADALNVMSDYPDLMEKLPKGSVLTPHLIEFDRLAGESKDQLERWTKAREFAVHRGVVLVLKGANTQISLPDGRQIFNSTGTHYMATAGAGDVLTGMITSFLGQGYGAEDAAICGVYHHGLAGELASKTKRRGLLSGDIIDAIPHTFIELDVL